MDKKKTHFIKENSSPLKDTGLTNQASVILMTLDEDWAEWAVAKKIKKIKTKEKLM